MPGSMKETEEQSALPRDPCGSVVLSDYSPRQALHEQLDRLCLLSVVFDCRVAITDNSLPTFFRHQLCIVVHCRTKSATNEVF